MVNTYKKGSHVILSPNFTSSEFDCKCGQCTGTLIDTVLVSKLEALRTLLGAPLKINSGYRCAHHQQQLRDSGYETASGPSQHELGRAADVMRADSSASGTTLEILARQAGFKAVGAAGYWIHVDLRSDKDRRWTYSE